ncbi:MAG: preprotein translocase subunit SecY [Candidatus Magasanikbacteria bacterium]|jgi:preprotein translocase subunit SecY|nr:preprotein translocase subunit SecY [Candidatus Magasanikbacteria bacterium]MBT4220804.1 preprotein translocase subunit SecY [Candidatus Magasanikbacteria bacterium]MBT4350149.1 preprotein translocase subunit SecY [Candidatus Magasanikbacteria bacterium]MBT4541408.1 preprotein translocase subunit SecY [Candidatus Magasanikbacteria bacterium]MBT6253152.1 preprotein translocase subunit SecY [Candidatus Magasanikbacteria bacterium]
MLHKFKRIWDIKDLRNSIIFVLLMLVIFRLAAHIPVPGVNPEGLSQFLQGNQILGLLNVFSGGTLENFSIAMLGVAPYITSAIIFQLLVLIVPRLEEMQKEGQAGQQKINMYTRVATVPLAMLQAFGLIKLLSQSGQNIIPSLNSWTFIGITLVVTAGTVFLMWIGELITEKRIGNGISLLILAGIIAALPRLVQNAIVNYTPADLYTYILFLFIAIATIIGVVFISEGQRNIPVHYARQGGGRAVGAAQSHLPLRVNTAGVIPIIFAISILIFPQTVAQFFVSGSGWTAELALFVSELFGNQLFYGILYFVLVFGFTYFYTAVIFHPHKVAENLQRQGGFIPGIRPGKETEEYIAKTMSRLVFVGAVFLGGVAILPLIVQLVTNSQSLVVGGTGLLIVVAVAIDIAKQIEAQVTLHEYNRV